MNFLRRLLNPLNILVAALGIMFISPVLAALVRERRGGARGVLRTHI